MRVISLPKGAFDSGDFDEDPNADNGEPITALHCVDCQTSYSFLSMKALLTEHVGHSFTLEEW